MNESLAKKLYEEHYHSLRKYAESIVPKDYAHDVVVDVFVKLYDKNHSFRSNHEHPERYLYVSVRNRCYDLLRGLIYRNTSELYEDAAIIEPCMDAIKVCPMTRDIMKIVEKLPDRMKDIIKLGFIIGMSNRDIADTLGIAEMSVRNQKCTALHKIRTILKESA